MVIAQIASAPDPSMCVTGPDGIVTVFAWDLRLVILSVAVAVFGSFAALECAERMRTAGTLPVRRRFFVVGAVLMGLAIWTMHFVGMLALKMGMHVSYASSWSAASILAAAVGAGLAFLLIERPRVTAFHLSTGAVAMGLAIVSMHYLGMKSMRMPAAINYEPRLFSLSVFIAIATSGAALKLGRSIPRSEGAAFWMKAGSAVLMGLAISGMHYVGMAAARYEATSVAANTAADPLVGTFPLSDAVAIAGAIFAAALLALAVRTAVERQRALAANQKLMEELEERVRQRTAELQARNNDLAAFSYSVSHDLRSPLRTIAGFSDALLETHAHELSEEARHYLNRINIATRRMDTLLEGLLTLARVSQAPIKRERLDLGELARVTLADLAAQEPDRTVEVQIDPGLVAYADVALLTSALQNLLANAWKFTGRNPRARIHFGSRLHGADTVYFIRDNGAGFDMAAVGRLFGMFERFHAARDFPGHGIGLAVTKRIVERHGGKISAESVKGEWAEFSFTLPPDGNSLPPFAPSAVRSPDVPIAAGLV